MINRRKKIMSLVSATLVGTINLSGVYAYKKDINYTSVSKSATDSNAPQLSIYQIEDASANKIIKIDAWDNDGESGIWKIEYPDGTFKEVSDGEYSINTEYMPTSTGTYVVKAYDKAGNMTEKSIYVNVDKVYPVINAFVKSHDSTKKVVILQVDAYVGNGGAQLSKLELPDGTFITVDSNAPYSINTTYEVSTSGEYTFKIYDARGLTSTKTLYVTVDEVKPQLEVYLSSAEDGSSVIKIDAWDNHDESGIEKVEISDGTEYRIKDNSQYSINVEHTPTNEGLYTIKSYDRMGNVTEKSINYIRDIELPKIAYKVEPKEDEKALISLDVWTENGVPLSRIKLPDNSYIMAKENEYSKSIQFEVNSDGDYSFLVVDKNGCGSIKTVSVNLNTTQEAERLVSIAETTRLSSDISQARTYVNKMAESTNKDSFQERLNLISDIRDLVFDRKTVTANIDVYIKSENMLSLTLDTNSITFEDFSGVEDMEKRSAVSLTVNSSLPYELNAYLPIEIQNSDKSKTMDKRILNIKESRDTDYRVFQNINDKLILRDNNPAGNDNVHSIDLKLAGGISHEKDVYKTTIKFEASQK